MQLIWYINFIFKIIPHLKNYQSDQSDVSKKHDQLSFQFFPILNSEFQVRSRDPPNPFYQVGNVPACKIRTVLSL